MASSEMITPEDEAKSANLWVPMRGQEVHALVEHLRLSEDSSERIVTEAADILGKCIPPQAAGSTTTGLVIGYVQSGKTLSFTTVAALARDNSYPMVIVITGTSIPLLDQSNNRLEKDLRLKDNRKWRLFRNPKMEDQQSIADALVEWKANRLPDQRRKSVLITVLKNTSHLRNLNLVLQKLDLRSIPVLVIDDEADQAGLNNAVNRGARSTTYDRLVTLRQHLPHHAYLQYTATPQAPLLINIIDALSPRFVELLTPGADYVGGEGFFEEHPDLIRTIPSDEIPTKNNPLHEVPISLMAALRMFFLGVAAGFHTGEDQKSGRQNRSMLVHPSRETEGHSQFAHWIRQIRLQWLDLLSLPRENQERALFAETFRGAFDDLVETVSDIPPFDVLLGELDYAIRQTEILEVNARPVTPQPEWQNAYPWILVGGQAMDRGFTVEGLTVTYMSRELGVGNADTIEQRARFFGYKRSYLGYCRVFLETGVRDAFRIYVEHERDIRKRLEQHGSTGRPLSEWRRAFFLDSSLKPTRRQVLDMGYRQDAISDKWFWPKVPHGTAELLDANRKTVSEFAQQLNWSEAPGDSRRTADQTHLLAEGVSLRRAYESLLSQLRFTDERDSQLSTGLLLQIEAFLDDHGDGVCSVYQMGAGRTRLRSVDDDQEIPTLFQGANYSDAAHKDMTYPGDEKERASNGITIQIHTLEVREPRKGTLIADKVPAVAVWIPEDMARDWLVQQQN